MIQTRGWPVFLTIFLSVIRHYFPAEPPGNQGPRGRRLNDTRSIDDSEVLETRN